MKPSSRIDPVAREPLAAPPQAPQEARDVSVHGETRIDPYFWLRERDDPRTLAYLKAENAYADAWLAPHAALKETLYQEMLSRIQQDDDSVPARPPVRPIRTLASRGLPTPAAAPRIWLSAGRTTRAMVGRFSCTRRHGTSGRLRSCRCE